jgi:hypothetical protein
MKDEICKIIRTEYDKALSNEAIERSLEQMIRNSPNLPKPRNLIERCPVPGKWHAFSCRCKKSEYENEIAGMNVEYFHGTNTIAVAVVEDGDMVSIGIIIGEILIDYECQRLLNEIRRSHSLRELVLKDELIPVAQKLMRYVHDTGMETRWINISSMPDKDSFPAMEELDGLAFVPKPNMEKCAEVKSKISKNKNIFLNRKLNACAVKAQELGQGIIVVVVADVL